MKQGYSMADDKLWFKGGLVIPPSSHFIPLILKENHDSLVGGHSGVFKTLKRIQRTFYWSDKYKSMSVAAGFVKFTSRPLCRLLAYSSLCRFPHRFGRTSVWTSLMASLLRATSVSSLSSWIVSASTLISLALRIHKQQWTWLLSSLLRLLNSMDFLSLLCLIETRFS